MINDCVKFVIQSLSNSSRSFKRLLVILTDVTCCILTTWLAFYLRLGEFVRLDNEFMRPVFLSVILALPIFSATGLYREIFRYSGWPAVIAVGRAIGLYGLIYASVVTAIGLEETPRTIGMIQPLLLFFAVVGSRVLACFVLGSNFSGNSLKSPIRRALIYGAGSAGRQLATALNASHEIQAVGF
jgi:Predicted nucleoside-diphosphate sugar epimerases